MSNPPIDDPRVSRLRILWSCDLDAMIEEVYGRSWRFQQSGDFHPQDTTVATTVEADHQATALAKIARWQASPRAKFPGRDSDETIKMEVEDFLTGLLHHGMLVSGPITISVWW